ncbi:hypothetical protein Tco_1262443 [Tanacetum coccineum]
MMVRLVVVSDGDAGVGHLKWWRWRGEDGGDLDTDGRLWPETSPEMGEMGGLGGFDLDGSAPKNGGEKMRLESEEENTMALELIKFVKKILAEFVKKVHKQTACGKDFSNPFMVDNLPKIVRFSTHLASVVKSWLVHDQTVHALASPKANELTIPEQTATGKGTSNPLMAGSLPKTTKPT